MNRRVQVTVRCNVWQLKAYAIGCMSLGAIAALVTTPWLAGMVGTSLTLGSAVAWYRSRWATWTLSPGKIEDVELGDYDVLLIDRPEHKAVWLYGYELYRSADLAEARAYAARVAAAVERPLREFSDGRSYALYAQERCRAMERRIPPEQLVHVAPCAPRRKLTLDRMTCFIDGTAITLGAHGVRLPQVEVLYEELVDVVVLPSPPHLILGILTNGPIYEAFIPIPSDPADPRYQQRVGEARWLAEELRRRIREPSSATEESKERVMALRRRVG